MPQPIPYFQLRKHGAFRARQPRIGATGAAPTIGFTFSEFYCQSGGSNLNGGSDTNNSAAYTSTNGNWNGTTVYIPTDGTNPVDSGVQAGQFASVYVDGATVGVYIARVLSVVNAPNGAITLSSTAKAGSAPTSSATGRSIKVGGAWKGPNGSSVAFPIGLAAIYNAVNSKGDIVRINMKNDASYSVSANVSTATGGSYIIQGYSTTPGDLGKATIDAGGNSIQVFTIQSGGVYVCDLIFKNNGTSSGSNFGLAINSDGTAIRCVANTLAGPGFQTITTRNFLIECEAYDCNKTNTSSKAGFLLQNTNVVLLNCVSHHNSGSNSDGFFFTNGSSCTLINCISAKNGRHGYAGTPAAGLTGMLFVQCDSYGNSGDGLKNENTVGSIGISVIRSCNFVGNGGYGINSSLTTGSWYGVVDSCGFGSNAQGRINGTKELVFNNTVSYPAGITPYQDPENGIFNIAYLGAIRSGRGQFTITYPGWGPTVGYPDIGAAQAAGTVFINWGDEIVTLPDAYVNHAYRIDWQFSQVTTLTLTEGSLPPGLSLTAVTPSEYQITGTPTGVIGTTYRFVIQAAVGANTQDGTFYITVQDDPDQGSAFAGGF